MLGQKLAVTLNKKSCLFICPLFCILLETVENLFSRLSEHMTEIRIGQLLYSAEYACMLIASSNGEKWKCLLCFIVNTSIILFIFFIYCDTLMNLAIFGSITASFYAGLSSTGVGLN